MSKCTTCGESVLDADLDANDNCRLCADSLVAMVLGDRVDYRAMLAIEVRSERAWRIEGRALKPADMIGVQGYFDGANRNLREVIERANGESL